MSVLKTSGKVRHLVPMILLILMGLAQPLAWAGDEKSYPVMDLDEILSRVEAYVLEVMPQTQVPGMAMAVIKDDEVIYTKAFGVKELGGSDPVDLETIFQIGSCSKAFTTALVGGLVEEGRISWTDKVTGHRPTFALADSWVTDQFMVVDLLCHRSGLPYYCADSLAFFGFDRDYLIEALRLVPAVTSFRSSYAYQNILIDTAGELAARLSGQTYDELLRHRIFDRLDMTATTSTWEGYRSAANRASTHATASGSPQLLPLSWPFHSWIYINGPAGGINSNITDMTKWLRMFINRGRYGESRVFAQQTIADLIKPRTVLDHRMYSDQDYYALGWFMSTYAPYPIIQHGGNTYGHHSLVTFIPEAGVGVVILTNTDYNLLPEMTAYRFYDLYFGNPLRERHTASGPKAHPALGHPFRGREAAGAEPEALVIAPLKLWSFAGLYRNEMYGDLIVTVENDRLMLTLGPNSVRIPLGHRAGSSFAPDWPDMEIVNADIGLVTFGEFSSQVFGKVTFDLLNDQTCLSGGCGEFQRVY